MILVVIGLAMGLSTLGAAQWALNSSLGNGVARAMALTTFSLAIIFRALECNDESSIFSGDILANGPLIKMAGWALLATFLVTELGFLQRLLDTTHLDVKQWVICIVAGSVVLWVSEIIKLI